VSDEHTHRRLMEALLFAAIEPLDEATLSERLPDGADVPALIAQRAGDYADRGVNLVRTAGRWALRTADDLAPYRRKHVDVQRKLSRAAVETLAIIAYHQPITRAEIEALRAEPRRGAEMGARARALSESVYRPDHALGALSEVLAVAARAGEPAAQGRPDGPAPESSPPGVLVREATFFALGAVICLLALYPDLHLAVLQALKDATEPLGHTAAFFALTVPGAITWRLTLPLIAGLSGLAVWLELAQFVSPGREPDLVQVAGSLAGIFLGLILAWLSGENRRAI